jgi:hypothetical protein
MKYLEEFGKGLISFANIGTVLIFLRLYIEDFHYGYLIAAICFFTAFYAFGITLIKKSEGE